MSEVVTTIAGNIDTGALIVDAEGGFWRVGDRRAQLPRIALLISNGEYATWLEKHHDDEITLVDESHGRAVLAVVNALGGEILMDSLPSGPDKPSVRSIWAAHLRIHHGVWVGGGSNKTDEHTLQGLQELHALEHASPRDGWVPHTHGKVT